MDFFKEIPQFIVKAGPVLCNLYGPDWEKKLEVLTSSITFHCSRTCSIVGSWLVMYILL